MAKTSTILDLDDSQLQFTETSSTSTTHTFNENVPSSAIDNDDREELIDNENGTGTSSKNFNFSANFFSIDFYRRYFDVDTDDVKSRVVGAIVPRPNVKFLEDVIKRKPDLYGPFWIAVTLVISVAVSGNLASYFQVAVSEGGDSGSFRWHYDFHKVTLAATAVFGYAWLVPSGLFAYLMWTSSAGGLTFLELICLYGYSLVIYIPISLLWLIQINALQWILVLAGAGLSGAVLVLSLYPHFKEHAAKSCVVLICVIVALHFLLACGFMLYFFHAPGAGNTAMIPTVEPNKDNIPEILPNDKDAAKKEDEAKAAALKSEPEKEKRSTTNKALENGEGSGNEEVEKSPLNETEMTSKRKEEKTQEQSGVQENAKL